MGEPSVGFADSSLLRKGAKEVRDFNCGWRRGSHLIPALPRPGGEGEHAGAVEVRTKGLRTPPTAHPLNLPFVRGGGPAGPVGSRPKGLHTPTPSTLQSAAADSSPYEGEPKRTRLRLAAR